MAVALPSGDELFVPGSTLDQANRRSAWFLAGLVFGTMAAAGTACIALTVPLGVQLRAAWGYGLGSSLIGVAGMALGFLALRGRLTPISLRMSAEGLQLQLRDGSRLQATWEQPSFLLKAMAPIIPSGDPPTLGLHLLMGRTVPAARITVASWLRLVEEARRHGLILLQA